MNSDRFYVCKKFATMKRQKKEKMIDLVDQWKQSSVSAEAFAQTHGISKSTFDYWVRKVREMDKPSGDYPAFIEMERFVPMQMPDTNDKPGISANPQMVLTFPGGLCLKIYG
jgi:hypothetical protein